MEANESVLRAGYRLDRYELLCPIASGGMATVWLARLRGKRGFEKLFAVKTIRTELVDDAQFEEMFLDEARIASGIQHPNVAQILDLGEQDEVLFIVMEWVDGDSLAKIRKLLTKRETRLPMAIVLRVLADACAGLHAAHELRDEGGAPLEIVHRDVSPHNILVASSGAVKIIDFGIAKAQNRRQGETRTGIVKGKVQYMAPEQVNKGGKVDRRADVWALGMCLHELVMGNLPYGGEDDIGVIRKLMTDEAPIIGADVPASIARVLERCIVLDADARFPTAAGMQRALEGAMKELGEAASSEDVAAFLRAQLPELANRRREAVGRAIDEARERGTQETESREDMAFAPTLVGDRDARARPGEGASAASPAAWPTPDARAIALTKRKPTASSRGPTLAAEESHVTSAALEQDPIAIPKKSRAWVLMVLAALAATLGAAALWPEAASRALMAMGWVAPAPPPARPQVPSPAQAAAPSPLESIPRIPAVGTPTPVGVAVAPAEVHPALDTTATHASPSHASALPTGTPLDQAPDAAPLAPSASAPLPMAPPESDDDPNNPYN
jgi:tRNA A-37 threonylcarbamoyl transferase component Bud32